MSEPVKIFRSRKEWLKAYSAWKLERMRWRNKVRRWYAAGNVGSATDCAMAIGKDKHVVAVQAYKLRDQGVLTEATARRGRCGTIWKWNDKRGRPVAPSPFPPLPTHRSFETAS